MESERPGANVTSPVSEALLSEREGATELVLHLDADE